MQANILRIHKSIGPLPFEADTINVTDFRWLLDEVERSGQKKAEVQINCDGGNWLSGQSMYADIKASPVKITTYNVGLAASAASIVFMAGARRKMDAHAKIMIHECAGGARGGIKDLEKEIQSQKNINDSMARIYAEATGKTVEYWAEKMANETWYSAEEALAEGLIHEIVGAEKKELAPAQNMAVAEMHSYYASLLINNSNSNLNTENNMKVLIASLAGLGLTVSANATEEQVAETIKTALSNNPDKARADKLAGELAEFKTAQVTALVESAVASGKITAEGKEHWTAMANADFKAASAAINAIPTRTKITANLGNTGGGSTEDSRKDWDFQKWSQEDPAGLKAMKANHNEQYTALLNSYTA